MCRLGCCLHCNFFHKEFFFKFIISPPEIATYAIYRFFTLFALLLSKELMSGPYKRFGILHKDFHTGVLIINIYEGISFQLSIIVDHCPERFVGEVALVTKDVKETIYLIVGQFREIQLSGEVVLIVLIILLLIVIILRHSYVSDKFVEVHFFFAMFSST